MNKITFPLRQQMHEGITMIETLGDKVAPRGAQPVVNDQEDNQP